MLSLKTISIIVSSENGVDFYKKLGFTEFKRVKRDWAHDELVFLTNLVFDICIYVDSTHPVRNRKPETTGIRYICFETKNLVDYANGVEIKEDKDGKFIFIYDPDGQPIQIRERI